MRTHCCVPECIRKGYREEYGSKVFYFQFPKEKKVEKKWIQTIRRVEGKDFKISDSTKVCSRHFRNEDLRKTLARKICLKPGAIPSISFWIRASPRKRKPPTERNVREPVVSISAASRSSRIRSRRIMRLSRSRLARLIRCLLYRSVLSANFYILCTLFFLTGLDGKI